MRKRIFIAAAVTVTVSVAAMAITRKPVLFALSDIGDVTGQPVVAIMNPFRDRGPERAAEALLNGLHRGDTAAALSSVVGGVPPQTYESEIKYRLHAWELVRRNNSAGSVELVYRTSRSPSDRAVMPLFMQVEKRDRQWQVTRFVAGY